MTEKGDGARPARIGVLALQGAFAEHIAHLGRLGAHALPVRLPAELQGMDGLVIPGGESTSIALLMAEYGLVGPVLELAEGGTPIMGTCAGAILLAASAHPGIATLGAMDIEVKRNAFGRQVDSFEADLDIAAIGAPPFPAVFIRAPSIERVGEAVEVMARLDDGTIVAARQGALVALAFHPELTDDTRFHAYFLDLVETSRRGGDR